MTAVRLAFGNDIAADIRIAQYESETRKPKDKIAEAMAFRLDVPTFALDVPNIDTYYGILHTLFALEDEEGFMIDNIDGVPCIRLNKEHKNYITFFQMLNRWSEQHQKLLNGKITKEEYDEWRYSYPASVTINTRKK